ncbi:MAG: TonB-dependent receptor [Chitinophagaceae bacterium]
MQFLYSIINRKKRISTLALMLLLAASAHAQNGHLKGFVKTSDGMPAAQVNVQLKEIKKGVISAEDGSYILSGIPEGRYTMVVSFVGLQTIQKPVEVTNDQTNSLDFTLVENETELAEIVVTASRSMNEKPVTIGKLPIKPMDLPQSVSIIGKDVLERQQVLRLSDALQNVTGVYLMGNTGGYQEEIAARGYAFGSSNTFKNGARYNNGAMPEMSGVEKIEFLKGGSAILFGNVAAGGIMNIITKKPKFERGGELSFRTGSYDFYKPSLDVYGALGNSKVAAYRLNTTYEKAGSFRDEVKSERFYINPSFLFKLGKKTELLVEGDYLKDDRTPDFGIGAIDYKLVDVPRSRFLGVNWGYNKAEQITSTATITHHLNSNWQLRGLVSYQDYDVELFGAARPASVSIKTDGTWARGLQKSKTKENYYIAQLDLSGKFQTGSVAHTLLFGADADKYRTVSNTYLMTEYNNNLSNASLKGKNIYDTINIFDPSTFNKRNDIPNLAIDRVTTSPILRYGIYVQDLVAISSKLKVLAGVRYSYQNNQQARVDSVAKGKTGYVAAYTSDAFSPRAGIVYQPWKNVSLFTSYTNTFAVNTGKDIYDQLLPASIIDQFEVGAKTDLFRGLLSTNVTLYKIINSNLAQTALTLSDGSLNSNSNIKELAGEVTSKGIEIDISTKSIQGVTILAGYSYNDTRYTKANNKSFHTGDRLRYNPAHTANAHIFYTFSPKTALRGFNMGLGTYYVGDRLAGRNPSTTSPTNKLMPLPDYFLFDISAGYAVNKFSVRLKMTNLLNKLSYNVHDDNSVNPIAPNQFAATVSYRL